MSTNAQNIGQTDQVDPWAPLPEVDPWAPLPETIEGGAFTDVAPVVTVPPVMPASAAPAESDGWLIAQAITFGAVGGVVGALIYAAFITITHIEIGYLSIAVGYIVAKAVLFGSDDRRGPIYQITAVSLTYCAVALGNAMWMWWPDKVPLTPPNALVLMVAGFMEPIAEFRISPGGTLVGLVILLVGLRAAFRMTSTNPRTSRHPFGR
jgi:hypothetical protein